MAAHTGAGRTDAAGLPCQLGILSSAVLYAWVCNNTGRSVLARDVVQNVTGEFLGFAGGGEADPPGPGGRDGARRNRLVEAGDAPPTGTDADGGSVPPAPQRPRP
jgi:hypothetical protein